MSPATAAPEAPAALDPVERRRAEHLFADGRPYRICARCIMDTSDSEISFDAKGVCNHCHDYERGIADRVFPPPEGERMLEGVVARIKHDGRRRRYDCILGLSGGVDSTYVAYLIALVLALLIAVRIGVLG